MATHRKSVLHQGVGERREEQCLACTMVLVDCKSFSSFLQPSVLLPLFFRLALLVESRKRVASLASCECSPSFIHPIFDITVVRGHSNSATRPPSNLQPNKTSSGYSMAWSLRDRSTVPQPPTNTMTPIMLPLASL